MKEAKLPETELTNPVNRSLLSSKGYPMLTPTATRRRPRILLVDDDPTVRDSLGNMLESEGYRVVPAENGLQALEIAKAGDVDLVLLDLNLPIQNGWETFARLTAEAGRLPVIIITARPNQLFTAAATGVDALLEKPMEIPALLRTIDGLLSTRPRQNLAATSSSPSQFA
jgi:DNA-binding response OmpR family regulator